MKSIKGLLTKHHLSGEVWMMQCSRFIVRIVADGVLGRSHSIQKTGELIWVTVMCSHWRATAEWNFDSETLHLWQWQCLQVRLMLHIYNVRWAAVTGPTKLMTSVTANENCLRYFSTHKLKQLTDLICYQWLPIHATWKHVAHSQNCTDATEK